MNIILGDIVMLFVYFLAYCILCGIINTILYFCNSPKIKIWLPKSKKYHPDKVSPIYKLSEDRNWGGYNVYKYSLRYDELILSSELLHVLFPYPIIIYKYKYFCESEYFNILESQYEKMFTSLDIEIFYEQKLKDKIKNIEDGLKEINQKFDKIKNLNSQFNENYE